MAGAGREVARRKTTGSLAAYEWYSLGFEHKHRFTREDNLKAQELARKAIELDPSFARAYVLLAWTHNMEIDHGWTDLWQRSMDNWLAASKAALVADPSDAEAHLTLGMYYLYMNNFARSLAEIEQGCEPELPTSLQKATNVTGVVRRCPTNRHIKRNSTGCTCHVLNVPWVFSQNQLKSSFCIRNTPFKPFTVSQPRDEVGTLCGQRCTCRAVHRDSGIFPLVALTLLLDWYGAPYLIILPPIGGGFRIPNPTSLPISKRIPVPSFRPYSLSKFTPAL